MVTLSAVANLTTRASDLVSDLVSVMFISILVDHKIGFTALVAFTVSL
jgi:hypothetical protein